MGVCLLNYTVNFINTFKINMLLDVIEVQICIFNYKMYNKIINLPLYTKIF